MGYFAIVDGDGAIVWTKPRLADGMMWSQPDRLVLALRDNTMSPTSVFSEIHISGIELLRLEPDTHSSWM